MIKDIFQKLVFAAIKLKQKKGADQDIEGAITIPESGIINEDSFIYLLQMRNQSSVKGLFKKDMKKDREFFKVPIGAKLLEKLLKKGVDSKFYKLYVQVTLFYKCPNRYSALVRDCLYSCC